MLPSLLCAVLICELCCIAGSKRAAAASTSEQPSSRSKRPRQPDPVIPSAADLKQVLTLILGEDAEQALPLPALMHWASAPGTQAPAVRIDESMVEVQNIAHLTADQYPVMQYLHQQGAFTPDGWLHFTQRHPDLAPASGLSALPCLLGPSHEFITHFHSLDII